MVCEMMRTWTCIFCGYTNPWLSVVCSRCRRWPQRRAAAVLLLAPARCRPSPH